VPRACLEVVANRKSETQPGNETSQWNPYQVTLLWSSGIIFK
jgi:hypothetical protein